MDDATKATREQRRRNLSSSVKGWNTNASARLQIDASARALSRALDWIGFKPGMRVIDIGGGDGASIQPFIDRGCYPHDLASVDILPENAARGRLLHPGVDFRTCEADKGVPFADSTFDLAFASTVFYEIPDEVVRGIAREMRRVARTIIIRDWTMPRPKARPVTQRFVESVFGLPVAHVDRGAMCQPVGRAFSAFLPSLYRTVEPLCPFGMKVYVLKL